MRLRVLIFLAAFVLAAAGCAAPAPAPESRPGQEILVTTTFSLLGDLTEQIGGEHVRVHSMVPRGTDPHEYQPLPADIEAATNADLLVWNGLGMETGDGWFAGLVDVAGKDLDGPQVQEAAYGVEPQWLRERGREEINPHAFLSPKAGLIYVENIARALAGVDPGNAAAYEENARVLQEQVQHWDEEYARVLGVVDTPILVTSERAFQYVAADYGLSEGYLWQIDTDEQGTPEQITGLISFIRSHQVHGLLVETNVDRRPLEAVSAETGVPIVAEVYSDELGPPGSPGETYLGYLEANLAAYVAAMNR